jgi:glycosyltransferase involved in cell wall biosynthesis
VDGIAGDATPAVRPLDVLFVVPSLERGGAERVTVNLANGLARAGATPSLTATDHAGPLGEGLDERIAVRELGELRVRRAATALLRLLRASRPDVVVATHTHVNLLLCALRPFLPRTTSLVLREPTHAPTELGGRSTSRTRRAQRLLYRRADLVIASSDVIADDLRALTGANVVRLENPVDIRSIRATGASGSEGASGVEPSARGHRRFVSVGRLSAQKSMDELIRAFAAGSGPEDRLEILGEGPDRERLQTLILELGLEDRVELCGIRSDHWAFVAAADVLVLASRAEGMPNAVLEALALGTPVLATTDLDVLEALAAELPPAALRLVPRAELAAAIAATPARAARPEGADLAAPLLPDRFDVDTVSERLFGLLRDLVSARHGRRTGGHAPSA